MKLMLKYLMKYKKLIIVNFISVLGFALVELGIPTIIAKMIDTGVMNQDISYIIKMGLVIVVISIVGVSGTILLGYCSAKISTSITRDIRNDIFEKTQTFSHSEFNRLGISSMITRTNNDAFQLQMFINVILRTALLTPVMIVISFIMIVRSSVALSLIVATTVPLIILGVVYVAKVSEPISQKQQSSLDLVNRISKENLTGIRVIRAFNNDLHETKRFDQANTMFTNQSKKLFKLMSMTQPIFFMLMNIAALSIFYVASGMINQGNLQVGQLVAFMEYLFHAMFSIMLFCLVFVMYPRAEVSAKRIQEVLDTKPLIQDGRQKLNEQPKTTLEFENVTFVYPDGEEAVLKDISFKANAGETVAFIGSTGSGKSTLINLIPRGYDVSQGRILMNGQDIRECSLEELRYKIGFIPQKAVLFSGTIADNIGYGKNDASMEEVIEAAKIAQAYSFIQEKTNGFDELITEGATNVSGGQRQRLSIARAIVKKPDIYVFDDSFSALDFKTDATLRKELKKVTKGAIVFIVAQRVSSIMDADRIIVLDEGKDCWKWYSS